MVETLLSHQFKMDFSLILMLSSLLQLPENLDHKSTDIESPVPLLFFTLITVLAHAAALYARTSGDYWGGEQQKTFRSFISEQMWNLDPAVRDTQWRKAYGMSYPLFVMIVEELKPYLLKQETYGGETMPPDAAVAMVLYRLTSGHNLRRIASDYKTGPVTVTKYTDLVTKALATKLYSKYVKIPSGEGLVDIMNAFKERTGLQNMCGAIDGSHVKIHKRPDKEYSPGNYKVGYLE